MMIHFHRTHHTHLSFSQSAMCHHSQTAEKRQMGHIKKHEVCSLASYMALPESCLPDMCLLNKQLWSRMEMASLTRNESHPQTESHGLQ